MLIVPLDAAHLFDLNAAILGWLLLAVKAASAAQETFYSGSGPTFKIILGPYSNVQDPTASAKLYSRSGSGSSF